MKQCGVASMASFFKSLQIVNFNPYGPIFKLHVSYVIIFEIFEQILKKLNVLADVVLNVHSK